MMIDLTFYHLHRHLALRASRPSLVGLVEVLRNYHRTYPSNERVVIEDLQSTLPRIVFSLKPADIYSGHVEVVVEQPEDGLQSSFSTLLLVDLPQIENFGNDLMWMLLQDTRDEVSLVDTLSFGKYSNAHYRMGD